MGYEPEIHPMVPGGAPLYLFSNPPLNLPFSAGGFGYIELAHRIDEYITIKQYMDNIKFYATLLYKYGEKVSMKES